MCPRLGPGVGGCWVALSVPPHPLVCTHTRTHTHTQPPPTFTGQCILWVARSWAQGCVLRDPRGAAGGPLVAGQSSCRRSSRVWAALRPGACARRGAGGTQAVQLGQVRRAAVPRGVGRVTGAPSWGGGCKDLVSLPAPRDTATPNPTHLPGPRCSPSGRPFVQWDARAHSHRAGEWPGGDDGGEGGRRGFPGDCNQRRLGSGAPSPRL